MKWKQKNNANEQMESKSVNKDGRNASTDQTGGDISSLVKHEMQSSKRKKRAKHEESN